MMVMNDDVNYDNDNDDDPPGLPRGRAPHPAQAPQRQGGGPGHPPGRVQGGEHCAQNPEPESAGVPQPNQQPEAVSVQKIQFRKQRESVPRAPGFMILNFDLN